MKEFLKYIFKAVKFMGISFIYIFAKRLFLTMGQFMNLFLFLVLSLFISHVTENESCSATFEVTSNLVSFNIV